MTSKKLREYLRSHVLGLVAIFIAFTGTAIAAGDSGSGGGSPKASASVVTDAKFKKLKRRVAALEKRPIATNQTIPTTLPPSGPAGGVLTGTYPNPGLAANSVGAAQIIDGNVGSAEVADNSLGAGDLGAGSVGPSEFSGIFARAADVAVGTGGTAENGSYNTAGTTAFCLPGEQVISGGAVWITGAADDQELWIQSIDVQPGAGVAGGVEAFGGNDSGTAETLQVRAYCLT